LYFSFVLNFLIATYFPFQIPRKTWPNPPSPIF
jgi:hypothetical protein